MNKKECPHTHRNFMHPSGRYMLGQRAFGIDFVEVLMVEICCGRKSQRRRDELLPTKVTAIIR
jgi:hypothetical protein